MNRTISSKDEYSCPKCLDGDVTVTQITQGIANAECNLCDYKEQYRICKTNEEEIITCPNCDSAHVVKYGTDNNIQVYHCKDCDRKFRSNTLKKIKETAKSITLDLHSEGLSSRKIQKRLKHDTGYIVTHNTICHWIKEAA
jgi:transposase-like protein